MPLREIYFINRIKIFLHLINNYLTMRKYFLLLVSIFLCLFIVFIPSQLKFVNYNWEVRLKDYLIVLIIPIFLSIIIALFLYTKRFYWDRLFPALIISYFLMFGFLSYNLIDKYIENQKVINIARSKAEKDIKKGIIKKIESTGLILPDKNYKIRSRKIDSLERNKYGYFTESTGCIILEDNKYYNEVVDKYLEKRNGKNWKAELKRDINSILKKYPYEEFDKK